MPKDTIKHKAAPISRQFFLLGLFTHIYWKVPTKYIWEEHDILKGKHASDFLLICLHFMRSDFRLPSLAFILSVLCLPSGHPLCSQQCTYCVYVWVYIHVHTCQVCFKASSIQLMIEKEGPSCESKCKPTPLYRCQYILFCVKMHIDALAGPQHSLDLFLWCTVLSSRHIWGFSFPLFLMGTLNHTKPFTAQSGEGQIKLIETTSLFSALCCLWAVAEDGLF